MAPDLKAVTFRLEQELLDGIQHVKDRDGISATEQVRRALQAWLKAKGVDEVERKRAATRKRS